VIQTTAIYKASFKKILNIEGDDEFQGAEPCSALLCPALPCPTRLLPTPCPAFVEPTSKPLFLTRPSYLSLMSTCQRGCLPTPACGCCRTTTTTRAPTRPSSPSTTSSARGTAPKPATACWCVHNGAIVPLSLFDTGPPAY
jgi:hypothetical protein